MVNFLVIHNSLILNRNKERIIPMKNRKYPWCTVDRSPSICCFALGVTDFSSKWVRRVSVEGLLRMDASGKYVRYTNEQVEALERVYHECPKPSSIRRQQLIKDCPILANIEPKQIKVWFQNRRCDACCTKPSFLPSVFHCLPPMSQLLSQLLSHLPLLPSPFISTHAFCRTCFPCNCSEWSPVLMNQHGNTITRRHSHSQLL